MKKKQIIFKTTLKLYQIIDNYNLSHSVLFSVCFRKLFQQSFIDMTKILPRTEEKDIDFEISNLSNI
ncbi:hypothetical protein BpHYR1_033708 [Brachionus plicatilis]|uniref:Uncharacterized protein n=1 Tax=Brachionus plicatilis TaxID=10195 RepID=A0A3M7RN00_BRAPC|nr:hypothetical protein BpHYR1_033708 [Brachionus plicatilis]